MKKRGKLEIIRDILKLIQENHNSIKTTPLLRKSNLSTSRFSEYLIEMFEKGLIKEIRDANTNKRISLTEKGAQYIEKYKSIISFIEEFEL